MNKELIIKGTQEEPHVSFDGEKGILLIEGRSMPEDAYEFYVPIIEWLENYVSDPCETTHVTIALDYFNSGSVKQVFSILCTLEEILETGKEILIDWTYADGDELMQSKGIEFNKFLDVDIEVKNR